jgi:hypothetical protein
MVSVSSHAGHHAVARDAGFDLHAVLLLTRALGSNVGAHLMTDAGSSSC